MTDPVCIEPVTQKDIADCGVAALAMLIGEPYARVSGAALKIAPRAHERGLWVTDLRRLAEVFNKRLAKNDSGEADTGILVLRKGTGERHFALLFQGVVVNPADGLIWDRDTYLAAKKWKVDSLEVLV